MKAGAPVGGKISFDTENRERWDGIPAAPEPPRGRHWVPAAGQPVAPGRHRPSEEAAAEPVDEEPQGEHQGGQSFAELMARFQVNPPSGGGGGRRRRED